MDSSKIKYVQTRCIFEQQKPQVVFDGVYNQKNPFESSRHNKNQIILSLDLKTYLIVDKQE